MGGHRGPAADAARLDKHAGQGAIHGLSTPGQQGLGIFKNDRRIGDEGAPAGICSQVKAK